MNSKLPKLDTTEAVIACIRSKAAYEPIDWHDDTSDVAVYLAECVRVRQLIDAFIEKRVLIHPDDLIDYLRDAMKGGAK